MSSAAPDANPTRLQRLRAGVADPVLRILITAGFVLTLGRGVFLTLTVLYFTLIVGLGAFEVAIVLTVSSAFGAAASVVAGHLSDRYSSRILVVVFQILSAIALTSYVFAENFSTALLLACLYSVTSSAASAVRSAIIARAFEGEVRVNARAVLHTVTNVGIAIGSAAAGVALLFNTPFAFRATMVIAGVVILGSVLPLLRLPERVNASAQPTTVTSDTGTTTAIAPGRSPYRDPRYLALTAFGTLFGLQFGLAEIGMPLWILHHTDAPISMVSLLLIVNTIMVIAFQIRASRGTNDVRHAGNIVAVAGLLMAGACGIYAASGYVSFWFAIVFLLIATLAHSLAEVLGTSGQWGLSFELADQRRAGAYQGVYGLSWPVSAMLSPLIITAAVSNGVLGWAGLTALLLLATFGTWAISRRALRG
ncbi:MFS transporter [Homoserinimonas aerilata]|uniref:MFS transporter n=1 Tax=Homoserinimonas aerilata TaxID=1162970 RepID=UPI00114E0F36|nr:MFS transporter [Homoserinimonas aerilata]